MAETIKATNIFVEHHKRQRNCCEEYSRLHSEKLLLVFLWMWDSICYTITDLAEPEDNRRLSLPEFLDSWLMKLVRLSALRKFCFIPRRQPRLLFLLVCGSTATPQCGRMIKSTKISNVIISNWTCDFPVWKAVPQPNAPSRASI